MKSLTVPARIDQLDTVQEFIQQELEAQDCMPKVMIQISIAVEEIFVNIAHYAYRWKATPPFDAKWVGIPLR